MIANFVGAFFFNIDTTVSYISGLSLPMSVLFIWGPAILGGFCFFIGGAVEVYENRNGAMAPWLSSSLTCSGGFCFTVAGLAGSFPHLSEMVIFLSTLPTSWVL